MPELQRRLELFLPAWIGFVALFATFLVVQALPAFYEARYDATLPYCVLPADEEPARLFLERAMRDAGVMRWSVADADSSRDECVGYEHKTLWFDAVLPSRSASRLFDVIRGGGPEAGLYPVGLQYSTSPAGAGGIAHSAAAFASAILALGFWRVVRRRENGQHDRYEGDTRKVVWKASVTAGAALTIAVAFGLALQIVGLPVPARHGVETITPFLLLTGVLLAPVTEEVIFRFWLLGRMMPAIGPVSALALSSAVFSLVHMEFETFAVGSRLIAGVALGLLWLQTGSLRACVLAHGLFNAAVIALHQLLGAD